MKKIYAICLSLLSVSITVHAQVVIPPSDELILPQYAYFGGTSPAHRMPYVCRLKLTGLVPGATYRYFTGMSTISNATTQTPGNLYRINNGPSVSGYGHITGMAVTKAINSTEINNEEMRTDNVSRHGRFTTDGSGNYTGWFACVPVNAFTAGNPVQSAGSNVYFYVQLNDGGAGLTLFQSFRTTSTIKLLDYSSVAGDANGCTPLIGTSNVGDEKMVAVYDNTAATGRPLYCTFTENNNTNPAGTLNEKNLWTNPLIYGAVDSVSGSWAAIVPNTLSGGVKAINFYNIQDASLITLSNAPNPNTSSDGTWNGVSTANPAGDSTKPIVINSIQGSTLPVTLVNFNGKSVKEGVRLTWTTSQEINNRYFEINRAGNEGIFRTIGRVNAVEAPGLNNDYLFVDPNPLNGKNYYQLKQVDKDGSSRIYRTIAVSVGGNEQSIRLISSDPSSLVVAIRADGNRKGSIVYCDLQGRVLYNQPATLVPGENIIRISVAGGSKQLGVVSFTNAEGERMNLKIVR